MMMRVEQQCERLNTPAVLNAILNEFSAITNYRTLRDSLPRRLASLIRCRSVLLYQRIGETLQFVSGSFDDKPGWSASLLAVAHINPIELNGNLLEARAWRERRAVTSRVENVTPAIIAVPLIYRQRAIGVLVAIRGGLPQQLFDKVDSPDCWAEDEVQVVEVVASIIAMLLENTRLLERDRERISELSLLNSISSQLNTSMYEFERVRSIVTQRAREISGADLGEVILPSTPSNAVTWISPMLNSLLLQYVRGQREHNLTPLVLERPGDEQANEYLNQLATNIKTFYAIPLLSSRGRVKGREQPTKGEEVDPKVLGVIVGAYNRPWKLRREELVLLQVLANQASAVLENISLMADVMEARNEARKLLRQVLDDQRLKELILESIPSGLITVDMEGRITTFNQAAEGVLGYHPFEVLGKPAWEILQSSSWQKVIENGKARSETLVVPDRSSQEVVLDVTFLSLRDDRSKLIGALATFVDVTTVHRLEEEKRRLDRLASLGEMAASVAHEVRNPLASIKTSMQMLLDDLIGGQTEATVSDHLSDGTQESVSIVLKEVERLDSIVHDLLLFAKPRQLHRAECNLVELSDHVLQLIQAQCVDAGVVVHRVYRDVPLIKVDMAQIEQVLFNLFMNALQAMPDGGVLTVTCQLIQALPASTEQSLAQAGNGWSLLAEKREIRSALGQGLLLSRYNEQQNWLELSVSDTGVGIPPDQLERIFQPFFTTKAHGIGLGLPITRRLIEDHNGYLLVESQFGYGATIAIRLPLADMY